MRIAKIVARKGEDFETCCIFVLSVCVKKCLGCTIPAKSYRNLKSIFKFIV